jgi:hypothetical protein
MAKDHRRVPVLFGLRARSSHAPAQKCGARWTPWRASRHTLAKTRSTQLYRNSKELLSAADWKLYTRIRGFSTLLHGCCTKLRTQSLDTLVFLCFAGLLRVGDAGIEPATSAV